MNQLRITNGLKRKTLIILLLASFSISIQAQTNEREAYLKTKANNKFLFKDYSGALPLFLELLQLDSTNYLYHFKTGVCYYESEALKAKCLTYFNKALSYKPISDGATFEFYYYIGSAFKIDNNFDKALECFALAKTFHNAVDTVDLKREIEQCELGKKLMTQPAKGVIYNLGTNVNSNYSDFSQLILENNSKLYFSSSRSAKKNAEKQDKSGGYFEYVYVSKNVSTDTEIPDFTKAQRLRVSSTEVSNDPNLSSSADGKNIYLFRRNKLCKIDTKHSSRVKPYKNQAIYHSDKAPSMCFTSDNKTMYFASNRGGGIGGKDIYKSIKQADGTWGAAINLGAAINTPYDEESPYFDESDSTLYFSSEGHSSIGGHDVFKSDFKMNKWAAPESMGYPINSGADDIFFKYNRNENTGYYTTMRMDGVGNYDIYMVKLKQPLNTILVVNFENGLKAKSVNVGIIDVKLKDTIWVSIDGKTEVTYANNSEYKMLIPRYNEAAIWDTLTFKTTESFDSGYRFQEINYNAVQAKKASIVHFNTTVYNAFFGIEKTIVKSGVRRNQVLLLKFPLCHSIDPKYHYYSNPKLTREEEYSNYIRTLESNFVGLKVYSLVAGNLISE